MKYTYNKLVRDNIVEQINSKQGKCATWRILSDSEYEEELDKKLIEEAKEFIEEHSVEELGDLMEVIENIMEFHKIRKEELQRKQAEKRKIKGSFKKKLYLESVDED